MGRDIKFRAWNLICYTMEVYDLDIVKGQGRLYNDYDFNNFSELMQFTGLKDKNGKEIYEGDILEFVYGANVGYEKKYISELKYYNELAKFGIEGFSKIDSFTNKKIIVNLELYSHTMSEIKVIGNIYENKELLENER